MPSQFVGAEHLPRVPLRFRPIRKAHRHRPFVPEPDRVADRRRRLGHGTLEVDAPGGVTRAGGSLHRHEVARPVCRIVLERRLAVLHQNAGLPARELVAGDVKLNALPVPGHRHIGEMPVHRPRRQHIGAVDRRPLVLVNRGGISVIYRVIGVHGYRDSARPHPNARWAVEPDFQHTRFDGFHRPQHAVLHPEIAVILQEHDPVALGKLPLAAVGLVDEGARPLRRLAP